MDFIRKFSEKKKLKSAKYKQLEEDDRLQTMLEERKKSSNQRELEKHYKDQKEKMIKTALDKVRKQRNRETWKDNSILKGGTSILHQDKSMLQDNKKLLHGNMFLDNKSQNPITNKKLFFKF